ncbi:hypothetical protein [Roseomonas populi]|uniref:Uncharacterized protein n=1 Tax=Roseomonas populi TaxID=3121582 RepID=A0ABT1X6F0_9PROT|nr:hypothetical protein [Roseomonas pecuniae]MCR0983681.1 hypothetical protein [Roseomonas pecuniae]
MNGKLARAGRGFKDAAKGRADTRNCRFPSSCGTQCGVASSGGIQNGGNRMRLVEHEGMLRLVRSGTEADPDNPDARPQVVGRIPLDAATVPPAVRDKLSPHELDEVLAFIARRGAVRVLEDRLAALRLGGTVAAALRHLARVTDDAERAELLAVFSDAAVALRRAGRSKSPRDSEE